MGWRYLWVGDIDVLAVFVGWRYYVVHGYLGGLQGYLTASIVFQFLGLPIGSANHENWGGSDAGFVGCQVVGVPDGEVTSHVTAICVYRVQRMWLPLILHPPTSSSE